MRGLQGEKFDKGSFFDRSVLGFDFGACYRRVWVVSRFVALRVWAWGLPQEPILIIDVPIFGARQWEPLANMPSNSPVRRATGCSTSLLVQIRTYIGWELYWTSISAPHSNCRFPVFKAARNPHALGRYAGQEHFLYEMVCSSGEFSSL